ncbi:hypothetical protein BDR07DRAFT_1378253 [Suillus spraguei]|nr:hypothetical protein BDR07DRAFT_1378253 [Suillus spraguei]
MLSEAIRDLLARSGFGTAQRRGMYKELLCNAPGCSWEKATDSQGLTRHHATCKLYQRSSVISSQKRQERAKDAATRTLIRLGPAEKPVSAGRGSGSKILPMRVRPVYLDSDHSLLKPIVPCKPSSTGTSRYYPSQIRVSEAGPGISTSSVVGPDLDLEYFRRASLEQHFKDDKSFHNAVDANVFVKKEKKQRLTTSAPAKNRRQNVDTAPEHMKSRGAYRTSDLPPAMQADQRWTKKFIPTIMIIPDDVLLHHVQLVFDVVYPELKIVIVHGGVIHLLTAQRISEWRSNFGSTGIHSRVLPSRQLGILYEDPDNINPLTAYRSPFILQLYGRAHLNAINGHVVIPSLNMQALDTIGMSCVLALSAAALERALGMIAHKKLKVQDDLQLASRGKFTIKLPKVLNKATGKKTNAPFLFSAARWSKATNSYIKSILSKPTGYVEATVKMAHTALQDIIETPGSLIEDDEDERAMILKKE